MTVKVGRRPGRSARASKSVSPPIAIDRPSAPVAPPVPAVTRLEIFAMAAFLIAAAFVLYRNALGNPYISDDGKIIEENVGLRTPSIGVLATIWTSDYWTLIDAPGRRAPYGTDRNLYRPFTITTYLLSELPVARLARLLGVDDSPDRVDSVRRISYRSVNVVLHAASALLVGVWCARRLGRAPGAAAALAIVAHPVATDVVNRLVGRADILVLLGTGGCLLVQHVANERGWTWRRAAAAACFAAVALFSKESGLIVVPLVAAQHWLDASWMARPRRASMRGVLSVAAIAAVYVAARLTIVQPPEYALDPTRDLLDNPAIGKPWLMRLPAFLTLAWHYVRYLLFPSPLLAFDVPARLPDWRDWQVYPGLYLVAGGVAAIVWLARKRHVLAIALFWLALNLLVVGQLLLPIGMYTEVRVMYAMTGALAIAAAYAARFVARLSAAWRGAAVAVGCAVLLLAGWATVRRNSDYASEIRLFAADLRARPFSAAAALRLGNSHIGAGNLDEAERLLRLATTLAPESSEAWYDLGTFFGQQRKDYRAALGCFDKSIALNPRNLLALLNGSVAAVGIGQLDDAWQLLTRAQQLQPGSFRVEYNMALVELARGETTNALSRLQALSRRDPDDDDVKATLKRVLSMPGT